MFVFVAFRVNPMVYKESINYFVIDDNSSDGFAYRSMSSEYCVVISCGRPYVIKRLS